MTRPALAFLLLIPAAASAQRDQPFAERGDLAIVAAVSGLGVSGLRPALGGVGLRYRVADRTVLGASLGVGFETRDEDASQGEATVRNVSVTLWNETHVGRRRGVVSPFVGAGVTARASSVEQSRSEPTCGFGPCPPGSEIRDARTTVGFGAAALLGAEVRLARGVTLGAAYGLGVEYVRTEAEQQFGSDLQESRFTYVRAGVGTTDLFVSVYF